jgi:hypothetical protein
VQPFVGEVLRGRVSFFPQSMKILGKEHLSGASRDNDQTGGRKVQCDHISSTARLAALGHWCSPAARELAYDR